MGSAQTNHQAEEIDMPISFHDASVGSYLQVLDGVAGVLDKGASHAAEAGLDLQEVVHHAAA